MDLGLEGKVALVCGSSRGLGRAVATGLAEEGARIGICARSRGPLEETAEQIAASTRSEILPVVADVAVEGDVMRLVDAVRQKWGRIDILITNAGGPPGGPFDAHGMEAWNSAVQTNFLSSVMLSRQVIPSMKANRWGRIINITSVTVKQPVDGLILSNAVRAAVVGLAKSLATELAPYNVLVNNIAPGYTRTDRLDRLAESLGQSSGLPAEAVYRQWERSIPLGRIAEPKESAALVVFLASERASYITGTTIPVDGGFVRSLF